MTVVVTAGRHHLLGCEHLPLTPGAGAQGPVPHNRGGIQGHGLGLGLLAVVDFIAVEAVDVVWAVGKVCGVQLMLTLSASEALLVVTPCILSDDKQKLGLDVYTYRI